MRLRRVAQLDSAGFLNRRSQVRILSRVFSSTRNRRIHASFVMPLLGRLPSRPYAVITMNQPTCGRKFFLRFAVFCVAAGLMGNRFAVAQSPVELRVDQLVSQLNQEEKIGLLHGYDGFYTGAVDRLKIPRTKFTDGPVGTRNDGASTAYPAGVLLASTWDPDIAEREGVALGRDARSRGDHILLGPGVNIYRQPQNGRNFEYLGEDPYLAGRIAVGYIQGVQSQGVAACIKHFACNNQEIKRHLVDVRVDERTLHEIYLPAFEAAVKIAHVRSIMASYNRINGSYATASHYLLTDVLRKEWGFDGFVMSDWGAVDDTLGPMTAGLDLEMPDKAYFNSQTLQPLLDAGKITQADIDEKVKHILRVEAEMGWLDRPQIDKTIARDDPANDATALAVAREGIVLLKNQGNLLPLDRTKVHKLVLLGAGADAYVAGGGSSFTKPARPVTILAGLTALAKNVQITTIPFHDRSDRRIGELARASVYEPLASGKPGLTADFYTDTELKDPAARQPDVPAIDFNWKPQAAQITRHPFSARWTATIRPTTTGENTFMIRSSDGSRVLLDGKVIIDNWRDQPPHTATANATLQAGRSYQLEIEYYHRTNEPRIQFGYFVTQPALTDEQREAIAGADAAIVAVHTNETEGADRPYDLDPNQLDLINKTAAINPRVIVVLEAGGNVGMQQWIDRVPALLDAWFPGQAGGTAIAEILFGDTNPSGHLPDTFEKAWPDSPAFGNYPGDAQVNYAEGIYMGYRWYDKKNIEPRFPFGFGLSYTAFELKNLKLTPAEGDDNYTATFDATNTGARKAQPSRSCMFDHQQMRRSIDPLRNSKVLPA